LSFGFSAEAANTRLPSIKMKKSGRNPESWRRINNSPGSSSLWHYAVSLAVGLHEHNEADWRHGTKINKSSGDNRRAGASIRINSTRFQNGRMPYDKNRWIAE
jgi:hypothetical protein